MNDHSAYADDGLEAGVTTPAHEPEHVQNHARPSEGKLDYRSLVLESLVDPHALPEDVPWYRLERPPSPIPPLLKLCYWIGAPVLQRGTEDRVYTWMTVAACLLRLVIVWPLMVVLTFVAGAMSFSPTQTLAKMTMQIDPSYAKVVLGTGTLFAHDRRASPSLDPMATGGDEGLDRGRNVSRSEVPSAARSPSRPVSIATEHEYLDTIGMSSDVPSSSPSRFERSSRTVQLGSSSLRPRYLCFVEDFDKGTYETREVSEYIEEHGDAADTEFVFISYTRMQFQVATPEEIEGYDYPDEATRAANKTLAASDRQTLIRWGVDAARQSGTKAFWLDFECVRNEDGIARSSSNSSDVYRICDIVRVAHSMIIAIGPSTSKKIESLISGDDTQHFDPDLVTRWLRQWGSRLWTLPELLLCPSEYRLKLYVSGDPAEPKAMAKRNFAERAWDDAEAVKELVDHFEGSAILTQLSLIETALACFSRRKTDQFSSGDIAYAIMGLLPHRQRPQINHTDSGFQAFARLSLANDSGGFLERLLCLLPPSKDAPWFDTDDTWGAKLSDIHPTFQVARVGDSDTILMDGVRGARIEWDGLDRPLTQKAGSTYSQAGDVLAALCKMIVLQLCLTFVAGIQADFWTASRIAFIVLGAFVIFTTAVCPLLIIARHKPPFPKALSPSLIGMEGFVDAGSVERHFWGFDHGSISVNQASGQYQDLSQTDPTDEGYPFTVFDTHMMTLTHFRAKTPPRAMFICGQQGGTQRALLCSYDWERAAYCRETVLRIGSAVLDCMHRVEEFRFTMTSATKPEVYGGVTNDRPVADGNGLDDSVARVPPLRVPFGTSWSVLVEVAYFFIILVSFQMPIQSPLFIRPTNFEDFTNLYTVLYGLSFLFAQVLYYTCLRHVQMGHVLPSVILITGIGNLRSIFHTVFEFSSYLRMQVFVSIVVGFTNSLLWILITVFMWSWFQQRQLAWRSMIWIVGGWEVWNLFSQFLLSKGLNLFHILGRYMPLAWFLACYFIAIVGASIMVPPREAWWLTTFEKLGYAQRGQLSSSGITLMAFRQARRQVSKRKCPEMVLVFSASLSTTFATVSSPKAQGFSTHVGVLLGIVIIGVVAYIRPRSLRMPGKSADPGITSALNCLVLPLLLSLLPSRADTVTETLGFLAVALIGMMMGQTLSHWSDDRQSFAIRFSVSLVNCILMSLLFGLYHMTSLRSLSDKIGHLKLLSRSGQRRIVLE